jgi:hypothetical protein
MTKSRIKIANRRRGAAKLSVTGHRPSLHQQAGRKNQREILTEFQKIADLESAGA